MKDYALFCSHRQLLTKCILRKQVLQLLQEKTFCMHFYSVGLSLFLYLEKDHKKAIVVVMHYSRRLRSSSSSCDNCEKWCWKSCIVWKRQLACAIHKTPAIYYNRNVLEKSMGTSTTTILYSSIQLSLSLETRPANHSFSSNLTNTLVAARSSRLLLTLGCFIHLGKLSKGVLCWHSRLFSAD